MQYREKVERILRGAGKRDDFFIGARELIAAIDAVPYPVAGDRWGDWEWDAERLVLFHRVRHFEVDLERMNTSAAVLDWICQVSKKAWASPKDVGDLVQAVDDLLCPQENLCSWCMSRGGQGWGKQFNAAEYMRTRRSTTSN